MGKGFIFLGSKITADGDCSHEIKRHIPWKESYDQPRQHIEKQRHYFANKGLFSQGYGFSSDHVWMRELVITFLPWSKHLLISWLQSPPAVILEPQKIQSDTVSTVSHLFPMK